METKREKEKAAAVAFAVCLLALPGPAVAQQRVDVTISNDGVKDMLIEVSDAVCGGDLFAGSLIGSATITVNPCAGHDGTAVVLVGNRLTGAINRYDGLQSGANIRLR
jgi:hypothetical protein